MPSFDIVSRVDLAEVDNAVAGITREIATRFDFKGSKCSIERKEGALNVLADDDLKLKQMHELLKVHMTRRKVEPARSTSSRRRRLRATPYARRCAAAGRRRELARQLIRELKDSKLKIQGRSKATNCASPARSATTCRTRSPLLRRLKIEQPLQYVNFRD